MVSRSLTENNHRSHRLISFMKILYYFVEGFILFFIPESLRLKTYKDIRDQIVLVTGGGSGIGQLMVLKFLKHGCKVAAWDVNGEGLKRTKELALKESKTYEKRLFCYEMNLMHKESIIDAAKKVHKDLGPVDILVNNAGLVSGYHILDLPDEKIEATFKVNTISHFYTIKTFLPDMIKSGRGHIVTVASLAGNIAASMVTDYCASKFANLGMHYSLDCELAQAGLQNKIYTTLVRPYFISTGMFTGAKSDIFSYLEPDFVAEKIVEAVRTNRKHVVLPWFMDHMFAWISLLPPKAVFMCYEFFGAFDSMMTFHGRKPPTAAAAAKANQINDNINNNNIINNNNHIDDKKEI